LNIGSAEQLYRNEPSIELTARSFLPELHSRASVFYFIDAEFTSNHFGNQLDGTARTLNSPSESPKAANYTLAVDIPQILFQV
jgi:hypothetical protein